MAAAPTDHETLDLIGRAVAAASGLETIELDGANPDHATMNARGVPVTLELRPGRRSLTLTLHDDRGPIVTVWKDRHAASRMAEPVESAMQLVHRIVAFRDAPATIAARRHRAAETTLARLGDQGDAEAHLLPLAILIDADAPTTVHLSAAGPGSDARISSPRGDESKAQEYVLRNLSSPVAEVTATHSADGMIELEFRPHVRHLHLPRPADAPTVSLLRAMAAIDDAGLAAG